jgi:uncharacterized membrane protein
MEDGMQFPPVPEWNAAHVILVHFPIGLLLFTPVMLLLALLARKSGRQFAIAAFVVLLAGSIAAQVAVMSGEAAEELAAEQGIHDDPAMHEALEKHEEGALLARNLFAGITILYLVYLLLPAVRSGRLGEGAQAAALLVFLLLTLGSGLILVNAAHAGGQLVHVHGILAPLDDSAGATSAAEGASSEERPEEAE